MSGILASLHTSADPADVSVRFASPDADEGGATAFDPASLRPVRAATTIVVGDVRVDNREQLCQRLDHRRDVGENYESDAQLIADCYREWGTEAFGLLRGDFAFVLWDADQNRMYGVRDALGMRSLFYRRDDRGVQVAATIRPLVGGLADLESQLRQSSVVAYLAGQRGAADATFYQDVQRLPAGHWLEVTAAGKVRVVRFWDPTSVALVHHASLDDYAEDFRHRFLDSVRQRLRASSPRIGLHVSGGFDSTANVAATHHWNDRLGLGLRCWAMMNIADHADADERRYMDEVLRRFPMGKVTTESKDFWALRPTIDSPRRDEPYLAPYFARYLHELETARELGIEVILSGAGGDEIGGSSMYLLDALLRGRITKIWPELTALRDGKHETSRTLLRKLGRTLAVWCVGQVIDRPTRRPSWLNQSLADECMEPPGLYSNRDLRRGPARHHLFRALEFCWTEPLISQSHQTAREFGVDVRHPFLDRDLFEWALAVPPFRLGADGHLKAPLRAGLADILPEAIVQRRDKANYSHYFDLGLRDKERPRILELLQDPLSAQLGYVDPGPLRREFDQYCQGSAIHRGQFWNWLTFEQWLRDAA